MKYENLRKAQSNYISKIGNVFKINFLKFRKHINGAIVRQEMKKKLDNKITDI